MRLRINKVGLEPDWFTNLKRPSKNIYHEQDEYVHTHGILYFCPHCGVEFYGEWHCLSVDYDSKYSFTPRDRKDPARQDSYQKFKPEEDLYLLIREAAENLEEACRTEIQQIQELKNCPVCSSPLKRGRGFFLELGDEEMVGDYPDYHGYLPFLNKYWGYSGFGRNRKFKSEAFKEQAQKWPDLFDYGGYDTQTFPLERGYEHMKAERRKQYQEVLDKLVNEKVEVFDCPVFEQFPAEKIETIKNTPSTLKAYILNLIKLENNIYSMKKRLEQLYVTRQDNEYAARQAQYMPAGAQEILQEVSDVEAVYSAHCAELERVKNTPPEEVIIRLPDYPVSPTLATPGFFNKKKVQAENERLLAVYEAKVKAYQQEVGAYERKKERQEAENRNAWERMIAEAEGKVCATKATLEEVKASAKQRIAAAGAAPGPAKAVAQITEDEIREAEELLKNLYAARNKLYGYDIVFGKYRNIVALSSLYEYLMAGRCDTLEGAHGAYNIYESEIRANQVIAQLSAVLDSLEQIQKNQYMIYTELKGIHSSLNKLNNTMGRALQSIQSIKANTDSMTSYMETIAQNTDVIAHNTAKTAYYAKINAELTNSLGFMMALN